MKPSLSHPKSPREYPLNPGWKRVLFTPSFWIIVAMMVAITVLHHFRAYLLPTSVNAFVSRHAVDRILFLFPIAISTRSFNRRGGLIALAITVLIMLPRVIWISLYPVDALIETVAVIFVGLYIIHNISSLEEEKTLRQEADSRQIQILQQLNKVAEQITSELELDRILTKVLQIAEELTVADGGVIALIDPEGESIHYPYLHNLPQRLSKVTFSKGEGVAGEVISTGQSVIVRDYQSYPAALPNFIEAGLANLVAVPIIKGEHIFGALTLMNTQKDNHFSDRDIDLLSGIGRQAGIAIENAHLYERMRFYAGLISRAQEGERKRIARELHDDPVQMLIALSRRVESMTTDSDLLPDKVLEGITSLQEMISTAVSDLRRFIQDLRPSLLDHLGLMAALEDLTVGMAEDNIKAEFRVSGEVQRLTPDEELILFRIVQEALNNARRHSGASQVLVQVRFLPNTLQVTVEDNGLGFDVPAHMDDLISTGRLGLLGMQERTRMLDGALIVQSEPGEGTIITVDVPMSIPDVGRHLSSS